MMFDRAGALQKTFRGAAAGGRIGLIGGVAGWHLLIGVRTQWDGQTPMLALPLGLLTGALGAVGGAIMGLCSNESNIQQWDQASNIVGTAVATATAVYFGSATDHKSTSAD